MNWRWLGAALRLAAFGWPGSHAPEALPLSSSRTPMPSGGGQLMPPGCQTARGRGLPQVR